MKGIIMEKEELKKINAMVKLSFGKYSFGNYKLYPEEKIYGVKTNKLEGIAKRNWFPIPYLFESHTLIGEFTSEDGSSLKVLQKYKRKAEMYATYYKKHFNKDVSIEPWTAYNKE